jgi:aspartate kinase
MIVYKFGGASVKDAAGIRNLAGIVSSTTDNLVIVVSAFGKTTNALEKVLNLWLDGDTRATARLEEIYVYHNSVVNELFSGDEQIKKELAASFDRLKKYLSGTPGSSYSYEYDQVVSYGEIWSTMIVAAHLNHAGQKVQWIDLRTKLLTDDIYRDANILWDESTERIKHSFDFKQNRIYLTQGFIGGTTSGDTTTLGREGSDYTAAILGNILDASKVVFWKDVPGILNADPKWFPEVTRLDEITYKEAVEMTFSGAKVIHPKTIKPLHNKNIPLNVRSFINPEEEGTVIKAEANQDKIVPVFVKKEDQILISILPKDFSFVMGENLARVFHAIELHGIKVNLVQASAVSINICIDDDRKKVNSLIGDLSDEFKAIYNDDAEMVTIRHYTPGSIELVSGGREVLLEQRTRRIVRFVMRKL